MRIKDSLLHTKLGLLNNALYELALAASEYSTEVNEEQLNRLEELLEQASEKLGKFTRNLQLINGFDPI